MFFIVVDRQLGRGGDVTVEAPSGAGVVHADVYGLETLTAFPGRAGGEA